MIAHASKADLINVSGVGGLVRRCGEADESVAIYKDSEGFQTRHQQIDAEVKLEAVEQERLAQIFLRPLGSIALSFAGIQCVYVCVCVCVVGGGGAKKRREGVKCLESSMHTIKKWSEVNQTDKLDQTQQKKPEQDVILLSQAPSG